MNYRTAVKITENKKTGVIRYFKEVCSVTTRISKVEYEYITDSCNGMDSFLTSHKGKFLSQYKTCIFWSK